MGIRITMQKASTYQFFFLSSDLVAQRGEKLELLIDKTENLVDSVRLGKSFRNGEIGALHPLCSLKSSN